jgi:hypothetical protein
MSETAILSLAGIGAALVGVWLGYALQESAESRRYLRDARAKVIALALETSTHLALDEVEEQGGPKAVELRSEFASDQFYALARVKLGSKSLADEAAKLGDAVNAGIASTASPDPTVRAKGRGDLMNAIGAFQTAVEKQTATRWERIRRKV